MELKSFSQKHTAYIHMIIIIIICGWGQINMSENM